MNVVTSDPQVSYDKLNEFLTRWPLPAVEAMTLTDYTQVGNPDTFTYLLEHGSEAIGILGGGTSSKFGIWNRASDKEGSSPAYLFTPEYKWFKKYGQLPETAFQRVKANIVAIIRNAEAGNFSAIDAIDIDSMTKWKIAFIYSNYRLLPIYKKEIIRKLAKHFEYDDYATAPLSVLHQVILTKKETDEDFFDFASKYYQIATDIPERNYYIIGSKYGDDNGNDVVNVFPDMLEKSAIATGFFWNTDFSGLVGQDFATIGKWINENVSHDEPKFDTSSRTLKYLLNLKKGDLVAVKSHGRFNNLTIIAYAEVTEVNGSVYQFGDPELGHLIHVNFLEMGLRIDTGLNYALTIHKIIPGEKEGHFEKIFGSYAITGVSDEFSLEEPTEEDITDEEPMDDDIRTKDTSSFTRNLGTAQLVRQVHNQIQNGFAQYLKKTFPDDKVGTERKRIDIWRRNDVTFFIYEVKPYNSAFACIREALGQLTDYAFSKKTLLEKHLVVVGTQPPDERELRYLNFLNEKIGLKLSYECYSIESDTSITYS